MLSNAFLTAGLLAAPLPFILDELPCGRTSMTVRVEATQEHETSAIFGVNTH